MKIPPHQQSTRLTHPATAPSASPAAAEAPIQPTVRTRAERSAIASDLVKAHLALQRTAIDTPEESAAMTAVSAAETRFAAAWKSSERASLTSELVFNIAPHLCTPCTVPPQMASELREALRPLIDRIGEAHFPVAIHTALLKCFELP